MTTGNVLRKDWQLTVHYLMFLPILCLSVFPCGFLSVPATSTRKDKVTKVCHKKFALTKYFIPKYALPKYALPKPALPRSDLNCNFLKPKYAPLQAALPK